ncbi:hypothetical protein GQ55_5G536700 [Panicum hallii var. hallii]|uniref:PXMP2/4 family protein 2 n=1 Tax=Panicum hallii var. hallii TaxID=1504633 RepID=A0A2T7DT84_9POAL|nr:hypothetical protein GQ55_5G536700 [Panicum hallii var. hallii]
MRRLWRWYQQCLASHPVRTQVVSSGILWASGDIGAQAVTHYSARRPDRRANNTPEDKDKDKEFKVDWRRVGITSSFGFAFVGPVGHYWYEYLDRFIRRRFQPNTFKFVASKVAADGFLFGPLDLLLFFSYVGVGQGRSVEQVKEDVKRDFIPALVLAVSCHGLSSRETLLGSSGSRRSIKSKTRRVRFDFTSYEPCVVHVDQH